MDSLLNQPYTITLLGGLQVRHGERRMTRFHTYKIGALFAYLAAHPQPHSRERLVEIFWPDGTPQRQRNNLSLALSSLRNQLEPPGVPAGAVIVADRYQVGVNAAAVQTDMVAFEQALQAASATRSEHQRAIRLQEAVDLYHGELLPGYYEDWIFAERQRLTEAYVQALRQLVRLLFKRNHLSQAIDYSLRRVAADPLREEAHRDLMKIYVAVGQPSAALQQFRELEQLLERTLQQKPAAATRQVAQEIETLLQQSAPPAAPLPPATESLGIAPRAPALPGGTVTFLLSDIVGFTRQWERAGDAFRQALQTHHALLRQQFALQGGREFKEVGDSFLVAFERASDALACAIACQRALRQQVWPVEVGALSVRMALHTGEATPEGDDYHGPALNRASRLVAAAQGGQILCSETTGSLLQPLPSEVQMQDLGRYRLRDLPDPEHLFQVNYPEMPQREFPAPNAEAGYSSHLPLTFTRFFGREKEIARVSELLLTAETRLVTVTGIGGTGKTRLALEVARQLEERFSGAVWFVPLADLSDASLIVSTIATALHLLPSPQIEALDQVVSALSRQPSLLILDNFEQLVEAGGAIVQTLLTRVPTLSLLITSRQVLNLSGEHEFALSPLAVPGDGQTLEQLCLYESVQLFIDRAQAVKPDFRVTNFNAAAVATLCDRLEGIPLAIELAAARAQVLTPAQMLAQLQNRFAFLATGRRDATDRHRTLRAAMEWSYRLLSPALQRFFARLSVFRGGWSWEAAEQVCEAGAPGGLGPDTGLALDYLAQLREASLVLVEEQGEEMRFRMLETLREYAGEQLDEGERTGLAQRHMEHFLRLAEQADAYLGRTSGGIQSSAWLNRLEAEHNNLRAALAWSLALPVIGPANEDAGMRLSGAMWCFWRLRNYWREGREWLEKALQRGAGERTSLRARTLEKAGWAAWYVGDRMAARSRFEQSLAIGRELQDKMAMAWSLNGIGFVFMIEGDTTTAPALYEECLALFKELEYKQGVALALIRLANIADFQGDGALRRARTEESLAVAREVGDRWSIADAVGQLAEMALDQRDGATACVLLDESLMEWRNVGTPTFIAGTLNLMALAYWLQGDLRAGHSRYEEARTIIAGTRASGRDVDEPNYARFIAALSAEGHRALVEGDHDQARAFYKECLHLRREHADRLDIARSLEDFAGLAVQEADYAGAARLLGAAEALCETLGNTLPVAEVQEVNRTVDAAHAALGEDAFATAWAEGHAMTLEQAISYALAEDKEEAIPQTT